MIRMIKASVCLVAVLGCCLAAADPVQHESPHLSPLALAFDKAGTTLYVAESTAMLVAVLDLGRLKPAGNYRLPAPPTGLAIAPDGSSLYVTVASPQGLVCVLDIRSGQITDTIAVGHTPGAPVVSSDGKSLYVCNRFDNSISIIDLASRKEAARVEAVREPFAAAITPDGKYLFVANLLPGGPANVDFVAAAVSVVDTTARKLAATIQLTNGSASVRGLCVSPDGKYAYVTHILAHYQVPTTQVERGWMNTNALSILDVADTKLLYTVLLDDVDRGAANPWGIACSADGRYICVAHAGTHEISVIDRPGLHKKLAGVRTGDNGPVPLSPQEVVKDLSFVSDLRRRIKLRGTGPRALAIVGTTAYAAEYFSDSLAVVDIAAGGIPEARSISLEPQRQEEHAVNHVRAETLRLVHKGEMLFNNAAICFQNWQSCASCHPDGRADGLNWDLLNDGIGNPHNTKSMLLSHDTSPAMITGGRDSAETAVRAGIRHILFVQRPEEDAVAIDAYLRSLKPMPSPHLAAGRLSLSARRGKELFEKAGCAKCHRAPLYTDMKQYDVGTGSAAEADLAFDTPTLVEIWRSAPYLNDGRAASMKEVLTKYNQGDRHGVTSTLSDKEIDELVEFILSLPE